MAKKIILIFLGIVIVAISGLAIYIATVDWNSHKEEIAAKFSEITGKKIEFTGDIDVSLLPQPTMTASNINIYSSQEADDKLATIDHMDMKVTLSSLLDGAPDVRSLSLIGAEIWITENAEGRLNWRGVQNINDEFSEAEANTRLQSLNIQNSVVHYQNDYLNIGFELRQINADIHADSLLGPYRLDGNFMKDNDHFGVAVSLGNFAMLTNIGLNFAITHPKSESYLRFDGYYLANEHELKGDFSGGSQKTADFANILSGMTVLEETYNVPLQFSVGIAANNEKIDLSSFIIKYSNFIEGAGNIVIPLRVADDKKRTIMVKYQLVNLDLRPIWSVMKAEYKKFKDGGSVYEPDTNINVMTDISAERVILNDGDTGYFENLILKGDWTDNALFINEFYASCSGNMVLTLTGSLVEEKSTPQYFVKAGISGKDFLAFLNAFDLTLPTPVQSTYRNINLSLNLSGNNTAVAAQDIKFAMDKMHIKGNAGFTIGKKGRNYEINLQADNINLDNYLPKNEDTIGAMANLKADLEHLAFLKDLNINVGLAADSVTFRTASLQNVNLEFNSANGIITVNRADIGNVYDSSLSAKGTIKGIGTSDINFADVSYDFKSQNMAEVIAVLQLPLPQWQIFSAKNFTAAGDYNGQLDNGLIRLDASADMVRFNYKGTIKQEEEFGFDGSATLKTTNFAELVNNVGGSLKISANTRGALNCAGTLSGTPSAGAVTDASCILGVAKYNGNIAYSREQNRRKISGDISVDEFNIENVIEVQPQMGGVPINRLRGDNFMARPEFSKDVFVYDMYRDVILDINLNAQRAIYQDKTFDNLSLHLLNAENLLQLDNLSLSYKGVPTSGRVEINYADAPQAKVSMKWDDIDLSGVGGSVYEFLSGKMNVQTEFESSATSFDNLMNNASGTVSYAIKDFEFKGWDISKIIEDLNKREYSKGLFQQIRDNLQQGQTGFDGFDGELTLSNGNWEFKNAVIYNENVQIDVSGTGNLNEWKLNNNFAVTLPNVQDIPPFSFNWSGLVNKPILDVNVENIVSKYDAHWEQIEAAEQAKKEAEQQALENKMSLAQQNVEEVALHIHEEVIPVIENHQKNSEDALQISWYKQQLEDLNNISRELDLMSGKAHIPGYTEEDVKKIEEDCKNYREEIKRILLEDTQHYTEDVTARYKKTKESVSLLNEKKQNLYGQYPQMIQDSFDALLKIEASQYLVTNTELKELQKNMEQQKAKMDSLYADYDRQFKEMAEIKDIPLLEKSIPSLSKIVQNMEQVYGQMDEIYDKTETALQKLLLERQEIYEKQQAEKEAKRRAEEAENAGNLLAENAAQSPEEKEQNAISGKNAKVEQTASTPVLRVPENYIDNGEERVFNITPDTDAQSTLRRINGAEDLPRVSGVIRKSYEENSRAQTVTGSGLLRAVDGVVPKPTGTITVK